MLQNTWIHMSNFYEIFLNFLMRQSYDGMDFQ